jgi:SAM-dependent methyltransferase
VNTKSSTVHGTAAVDQADAPWQLKLFSKSLKKQQKARLLLEQLRPLGGERRLLVTNGDNNGALNHHLRASGGRWTWVENEEGGIAQIEELVGEPVLKGDPSEIPAPDAAFDVVVSIDVHEHLQDCTAFNRELERVTKPGGHVIVTTPSGSAWRPATLLKRLLGMSKEKYGHVVWGYTIRQHQQMLSAIGFEPVASRSYSRFFTELIELGINFMYVVVLSRKRTKAASGQIAPSTRDQLRAVEKQYRLYSAVYPFLLAISKLDHLLPFTAGYAVSVVARRKE